MKEVFYYITLIVLVIALISVFSIFEAFVLETTNSYFSFMNACVAGTIVAMTKDKIKKFICKKREK